MAVSSSLSNLLLLVLMTSLDWLSTPGSAFLLDRHHIHSLAPSEPHFTECVSRDQATFRCWWSPGNFHNLSYPGALRVFYLKKEGISPTSEWKECPEYNYSDRECFFDANHTSIWTRYCMQLRTLNNVTYYDDDDCFTVENIVRPDPPVSLNWTLLKISPSGQSYDIKVNWEPPPSADVKSYWMRLEYEIQYRDKNTTHWESLAMVPQTQQTIYGLDIEKEYEVHIRCRMHAFTKFGQFSDSLFILVTEIPNKESTFPITLVFVFGVTGVVIVILLIVVSQQHRLMMILLPPVPVPKIKGIDPEMLKKGKLDELNFFLSGGGMGGLPTYAPDYYQDEPWVEFIEVDAEDAEAGEKEENNPSSDTQRLLGLPQPVSHHTNTGCSNAISFPDDDSGRACCYDPDLPDQDALLLMATLLPGQPEDGESTLDVADRAPPAFERGLLENPLLVQSQSQSGGPRTWVNTDFYAQVSNVMPSGGVVLSPGQQLRIQEEEEEKKKKGNNGPRDTEAKKQQELQFQLLVVDPEGSGGYTTESYNNAQRQIISSTPSPPPGSPRPGEYQTIVQPQPASSTEENQCPYIVPDSPQPAQFFAPVADYTVVQEVNSQHSLLLNPPPRHSPPPCLPQHALKALPAMPIGYITPDLLENLSP